MRHLIALLLCAASTSADYVVDWRVPVANDANANAWVAAVVVPVGEKVVLEWTDYFAFHNVFRMKDKAAYDACDFDGAVELAPSAATGSVTIEATETTTYYACEIGDGFHCDNGQKLSVTGSDAVVETPTPEPTMMPGHGDGGHDHSKPGRLRILRRPLHRHLVPAVQELSLSFSYSDALCIRSKNSFTWWNGTPAKRARLSSSAESPT